MSFGQTRPKLRRLPIMHSTMIGKKTNSMSAQTPHSNCQARWRRDDDLGGSLSQQWTLYQSILESNVRTHVQQLKLAQNSVIQQDDDHKHTSKSTTEWLKKKRIKMLQWPIQSPDLNPIEMLWPRSTKVHAALFLRTAIMFNPFGSGSSWNTVGVGGAVWDTEPRQWAEN